MLRAGKSYYWAGRWRVDWTNAEGTVVNMLSFGKDEKAPPKQADIDSALVEVETRMAQDAITAAASAVEEKKWTDWLEKEGGLEGVKVKVLADPTVTVQKAVVK